MRCPCGKSELPPTPMPSVGDEVLIKATVVKHDLPSTGTVLSIWLKGSRHYGLLARVEDDIVAILSQKEEECSKQFISPKGKCFDRYCPIHNSKEEPMGGTQEREEVEKIVTGVLNAVYSREMTITDGIEKILSCVDTKRPDATEKRRELPCQVPCLRGTADWRVNELIDYLQTERERK